MPLTIGSHGCTFTKWLGQLNLSYKPIKKLTLHNQLTCGRLEPLHVSKRNYSTIPSNRYLLKKRFSKMASESLEKKSVVVACVQLCCDENKDKNFEIAKSLVCQAKDKGAKVVFLPEAFDFIGRSKEESAQLSELIDGPLITAYCKLAKDLDVWLSLGGFHERQMEVREGNLPWMTNNHLLIDSNGKLQSIYRKVHLFDVVIPEEKVFLQESSFIKCGNEIAKPVETPIGNLGLGICYDLRFPRFSLTLRSLGADILTYPSAFTVPTGQAHWNTLLRARAIETQCFVIAAAQTGQHNSKRSSYGHSLIVDPWGKILADGGTEVGVITAEINLNQIASVRKKMPVVEHSRPDLYAEGNGNIRVPNENETNVLVSPKKVVERLSDPAPVEVGDIFCLAQKVQTVMENIHGASSSTITVQDGKDAGQTIKHVRIHVMPRKPNDFKENDEIYEKLKEHDKGDDVKWRDESDMIAECKQIREHIIREKLLLHNQPENKLKEEIIINRC